MAEKAKKEKETPGKVVLERVYNVPLRKEWLKTPKYRRSKKAVTALKEFLIKHMKSENVKIGRYANLFIWKHGIKNPPHHVKVSVTKDDKGLVFAELVDSPKKEKLPSVIRKRQAREEKKPKKEKAETKAEKIEEKVEEAKEEKAEKAKEIEKEEIKELKKEEKATHAIKTAPDQKMVEQHPSAPMGR
ncbi:MAG: 60S ribosomal protein L31 [Nanoarchaeota archaeon]|nr:60S ribosomal protein L31 [Nanoarchaeota archaeon]